MGGTVTHSFPAVDEFVCMCDKVQTTIQTVAALIKKSTYTTGVSQPAYNSQLVLPQAYIEANEV